MLKNIQQGVEMGHVAVPIDKNFRALLLLGEADTINN